ncbi:hypothetical protein J1P26_00230 [Neobacillus sp. MM2021_6]|uniref:YphA family membrane protein n=1 Tax=Bacillaceae TaxID=186817 RepID=UPI001409CBA4|nr:MULTISPECIES: hypothetical protein [Bacillaceae]MBO0958142.1 hypothetical protein [Neobacillus sp. MM2021_6]NHC18478.1 hypothetical protein [Bacillus sp. MM2020_4]
MEGTMFYWISWSFWVFLTFVQNKKSPYRLKLSAIILILLYLSNFHFKAGSFEIRASGVFLLMTSYFFLSKEKRGAIIYYFICSLIVSIAYVTFHLFEIFDPIWIIFKKEWMMGIVFGYLAILLQKTLKGRLLIIIIGTMQGEFLYAFILNKFPFPYPIGAFEYLDVCALLVVLLVGWSFLENAGSIFQSHFHFFEKGKQKST